MLTLTLKPCADLKRVCRGCHGEVSNLMSLKEAQTRLPYKMGQIKEMFQGSMQIKLYCDCISGILSITTENYFDSSLSTLCKKKKKMQLQ